MEENNGLEKYKVLDKLDSRNSVYLVRDVSTGSLWVKKFIEKDSVGVYGKLMSIRQDNIANVKEMYLSEDGAVVIEQYAVGKSISSFIENGCLFTVSQVRHVAMQLCDALQCLHKNNIVHRDVTVNNVIISDEGNVKLIDMGISRIKDPYKTSDTHLMGTPGFAAPEQFGFRQTDERADIFSLGVLMNVMLTGELPSEEIYCKNYRLKRIISRSIELEPENRYKKVSEIKRRLITMPTEKDNGLTAFLKEMPGVRTMTPWKMIVAGAIYTVLVFTFLLMNGIFISEKAYVDIFLFNFWFFAGIFLPCLVGGNFLYYTDRIPGLVKAPAFVKTGLCVFLGILLALAVFTVEIIMMGVSLSM